MTRQTRLQLQYVALPFIIVLCLPFVYEFVYDFGWIARAEAVQIGVLAGSASAGLKKAARLYGASEEAEASHSVAV